MNWTLILVGTGGFLGSVSRYYATVFLTKTISSSYPFGTWAVNILGCLLIGIFYGLSERYQWASPEWRLFFVIGFCGGFTTFSAFAYENICLLQSAKYGAFFLYSLSSFILGLLAVFLGLLLTKTLQ